MDVFLDLMSFRIPSFWCGGGEGEGVLHISTGDRKPPFSPYCNAKTSIVFTL